jgi:hypothetical protein
MALRDAPSTRAYGDGCCRVNQLGLFPVPAVPQPLTDRQEMALSFLKEAGRDGLTGEELGRLVLGGPNRYAKSTGLELLKALKKKGHARETKGKVFVALDLPEQHTTDQDIPY